jgi:diaminopimelate epimerase
VKLQFSKMHGLGNDFMVIDAINQSVSPEADQVRQWANRHSGIGFDQLLLVEAAETSDAAFKYRIFNADGGEVSQCGNGARCFARFVRERGLTELDVIPVETNAGLITLTMVDQQRVQVNMGVPQFEPSAIPLDRPQRELSYQTEYEGRSLSFSALSIGNPHMVMQVEELQQLNIKPIGSFFESHPMFPEKANIGFMQVNSRQGFDLRVFERGVGETRACGSGACAAMVAGCQLGLLDGEATASLLGGDLQLQWQGEGKPVMMTGETAMVFTGEIDYE